MNTLTCTQAKVFAICSNALYYINYLWFFSMFNIGIFIYHQAEVLDFCGPYEVFRATSFAQEQINIKVFIIAEEKQPVDAQGMLITPNYSFEDCPELDILLIPGGNTMPLLENEKVLGWISKQNANLKHLMSVCTGALVLAKLQLLDEMTVTTHHCSFKKIS